jgi:hypothetical protein
MEEQNTQVPDRKHVKEQLDEILELNFRKLDRIAVLGNSLPLDMITVACLHLLSEREIEIEEESEKKRYDKNEFLNDMTEIGFDVDEELLGVLQNIIDKDYVEIDAEGGYHTRMNAMELVANINRMFPGMPGMNLIAYVLQTLEEIMSDRKDLGEALEQFDNTLMSRGQPLSFVHLRTEKKTETQRAQERIRRAVEREESRKASEMMKSVNKEKLALLRQSLVRDKEEPMVVTKRVIGSGEIQIKEISPHKIKEAKKRERLEKERLEQERIAFEKAELERKRQELERLAQEQAERERVERERLETERRELEALEQAKREEAERLRREREEKERHEREREKELKERERIENEKKAGELSIEEQIAAFEKQQASVCPLCHQGKIVKEVTESNREYYRCDNRGCKFISWDKPHPYPCPQCRNPYLLEFRKQDGSLGLKCPLATCSYIQGDLAKPGLAIPAVQSSGGMDQPKKKRLVRRKR